jgi:hypothetical protein
MANAQKGEVSFDVNGRSYTMRLDLNAMAEMETKLSTDDHIVTAQQIIARAEKGQVSALRVVVWAGMRPYHPKLTLEAVGDLLEEMGPGGIGQVLKRANAAAMPKAEGTTKVNPPKARPNGRGSDSTSEHAPLA